jgi:Glucose / Sorbosone dehydrogenase
MTSGRMIAGRRARLYSGLVLLASFLASVPFALAQYPSVPQITKDGTSVLLEDYASLPLSSVRLNGPYPAPIDFRGQLGKVNSLRSEPPDAPRSKARFFIVGQNGILYLLDKSTKEFTTYIDFGKVFPKFNTDPNLGMGVVTMEFDPAYAKNGKFYTIHTENPAMGGSAAPGNAALPGLDPSGFAITASINPPAGEAKFESVITEWKDTGIGNSTFEGTAREILRIGTNFARHPVADLLFNPLARPGDADYGNLYVSTGDGEAGERAGVTHTIPQRLDALQGKILRITPDIALRPKDKLSPNGSYRIPTEGSSANPFVSVSGARGEIYAYGLRNPHRMSWDPVTDTFLAADIGNHSWEELNIIVKGANYGWAEREGPEQTFVGGPNGGRTAGQIDPPVPFPSPDTLIVDGIEKPVTPVYPVAAFSHRDGIAVGGGFVYRGKSMPQLVGKYLFSDIASGRLFYSDLAEMLAAQSMTNKQAKIHELQIVYKSSYDNSPQGPVSRRMFDIVADAFSQKKGVRTKNCVLPDGSSNNGILLTCGGRGHGLDPYGVEYGGGRADVRLAMDGDGELYVLSKSDGMIRKMVSVVTPPPASKSAAAR